MKSILVTGAHRPGSTWVGKMLAASPMVAYIQEPFNVLHDLGLLPVKFENWFQYICKANETEYVTPIQHMLGLNYNAWMHYRQFSSVNALLGGVRNSSQFYVYRLQNRRPLIKDPIALFSAEWLASKFNMQVLILIRHPAAFVGSLKTKNWSHPFAHFLNQPLLMEQLAQFRPEIEKFAKNEQDIIDQACLLWKLMYATVAGYRQRHPDWLFLRHEDISASPLTAFENIYASLGLSFTAHARQVILSHSAGEFGNTSLTSNVYRDSASNIWFWKKRLSAEEIARIKAQVGDWTSLFYDESNW